jgi:3-mercaptopyruvate sulfurtransferase SseA
LRKRGITKVRPLAGGIAEWRAREFPLEARPPAVVAAVVK